MHRDKLHFFSSCRFLQFAKITKSLPFFAVVFVISFALVAASCQTAKKDKLDHDKSDSNPTQLDVSDWREGESSFSEDYWQEESEGDDEGHFIVERMPRQTEMTPQFCQAWNPEYEFRKNRCCAIMRGRNRRTPKSCAPRRRSGSLCEERDQKQLGFQASDLESLNLGAIDQQAFCTPDNGFMAQGVPILETPLNRVKIANPRRCSNFGTTGLVILLHQLGKSIHEKFSTDSAMDGVRLIIGDMSGPKGGCLGTGKSAHAGHTNGLDADIAFLQAKAGVESSRIFSKQMDLSLNWWLLKSIVKKTPVCLQYIFLDRSHIRRLEKFVRIQTEDAEENQKIWTSLRRILRHTKGHRNHFHIRVGANQVQDGKIRCGE